MQCKNSKNFLVLSVAQGNAVALLYSDWGYKLPVWRKRATINLYYERTFWCILISVSCHSYDFIIVVINSWLCEITSSMVYNFVILFTLHAWYKTLLYFYLYARYNTLLYFYLYFFFQSKGIYYSGTVVFCCHSVLTTQPHKLLEIFLFGYRSMLWTYMFMYPNICIKPQYGFTIGVITMVLIK